jgi:hypothetical protein
MAMPYLVTVEYIFELAEAGRKLFLVFLNRWSSIEHILYLFNTTVHFD